MQCFQMIPTHPSTHSPPGDNWTNHISIPDLPPELGVCHYSSAPFLTQKWDNKLWQGVASIWKNMILLGMANTLPQMVPWQGQVYTWTYHEALLIVVLASTKMSMNVARIISTVHETSELLGDYFEILCQAYQIFSAFNLESSAWR